MSDNEEDDTKVLIKNDNLNKNNNTIIAKEENIKQNNNNEIIIEGFDNNKNIDNNDNIQPIENNNVNLLDKNNNDGKQENNENSIEYISDSSEGGGKHTIFIKDLGKLEKELEAVLKKNIQKKKNYSKLIKKIKKNWLYVIFMKISSIVIFITFLIVMIVSVTKYKSYDNKHNYILMCFEFYPKARIPFLTDEYSLYLVFILIFIMMFISIYTLIVEKIDSEVMKTYIKYISYYYHFSIICLMASAIMCINYLKTFVICYINIVLYGLAALSGGFIILKNRNNIYPNIKSMVLCKILPSATFSLICYLLLFTIGDVCTRDEHNPYYIQNKKNYATYTCNAVYFVLSISLLSYNMDIIFPTTLVILGTGMLSNSFQRSLEESAVCLCNVAFNFYAVVLLIFTKKLSIFKLEKKNDIEKEIDNLSELFGNTNDINVQEQMSVKSDPL